MTKWFLEWMTDAQWIMVDKIPMHQRKRDAMGVVPFTRKELIDQSQYLDQLQMHLRNAPDAMEKEEYEAMAYMMRAPSGVGWKIMMHTVPDAVAQHLFLSAVAATKQNAINISERYYSEQEEENENERKGV